MKVILKDDVEKLGKCGEVVEVKDGYGRNYLFPRNLAVPASRGDLKSIEEIKKQKEIKDLKKKRQEERQKIQLEKISCTAEVLVGEEDRVFGSVTSQSIAELLKEKGFEIDRHLFVLIGEYREIIGLQCFVTGHHNGGVHVVLEFSDITRPLLIHQHLYGLLRNTVDRFLRKLRIFVNEVIECVDINDQ